MGQVFGKGIGNSNNTNGKNGKRISKFNKNKNDRNDKSDNPVANMSLANGTNTYQDTNNTTETITNNNGKPVNTNVFHKKKKANKDGIRRKIEDLEFQLKSIKVSHLSEIEDIRKEIKELKTSSDTVLGGVSTMMARMDAADSVVMNLIGDQALMKSVLENNTRQHQKTVSVVVEALSKVCDDMDGKDTEVNGNGVSLSEASHEEIASLDG